MAKNQKPKKKQTQKLTEKQTKKPHTKCKYYKQHLKDK